MKMFGYAPPCSRIYWNYLSPLGMDHRRCPGKQERWPRHEKVGDGWLWWFVTMRGTYWSCSARHCLCKFLNRSRVFAISLPSQWVIKLSGRIKIFFTPLWFHSFRWKHCNENKGIFQWSFEWDCRGVIRILCTLPCLTWVKSIKKILAPCDSTHLSGNTGGLQGDHRVKIIILQVMFEWTLEWDCKGANKSAHWDGWETENPLELYCIWRKLPYVS